MRRTILHLLGHRVDRGGILTAVRGLADSDGHHHHCLLVHPGFEVRRRPSLTSWPVFPADAERAGWKTWKAAFVLGHRLAYEPAFRQCVVLASTRAGHLAAAWAHALGHRRVLWWVHHFANKPALLRALHGGVPGRVFWQTPFMARYYRDARTGWERCLPPCLPRLDDPSPMSLGRRPGGARRTLRLAGVGELSPWKRWDLVVEALERLDREDRARVEFHHYGAAPESGEAFSVLSEATARGLPVFPHGWARIDASFWAGIDAMVLPSDREPFGLSVLESLAHGCPVVVAAAGGPGDYVRPGIDGWLFPPGDAEALARILRGMIRRPMALASLAPEVPSCSKPETVAQRFAEVYAGLEEAPSG